MGCAYFTESVVCFDGLSLSYKTTRTITDPQILLDEAQRAIDAMGQLADAMGRADSIMQAAADEHFERFEQQVRTQQNIDKVEMSEPYLPAVLAAAQLDYVQRLQRQLAPLQAFVEASLTDAQGLIDGALASVTIKRDDTILIPWEIKRLNFRQPLKPQIDDAIARAQRWAILSLEQTLDRERQQRFGFTHYIWVSMDDERVRPAHAANDGRTFSWERPPDTGHPGDAPNCRCLAFPSYEGYDPGALQADYDATEDFIVLQATLVAAAAIASRSPIAIAAAAFRLNQLRNRWQELQQTRLRKPPEWTLGKHKSETKWQNQMNKRGWDDKKIVETLQKGKKHSAPNRVNPSNGATRYEYGGKYLVQDDVTKEILQLGEEGFIRSK